MSSFKLNKMSFKGYQNSRPESDWSPSFFFPSPKAAYTVSAIKIVQFCINGKVIIFRFGGFFKFFFLLLFYKNVWSIFCSLNVAQVSNDQAASGRLSRSQPVFDQFSLLKSSRLA